MAKNARRLPIRIGLIVVAVIAALYTMVPRTYDDLHDLMSVYLAAMQHQDTDGVALLHGYAFRHTNRDS